MNDQQAAQVFAVLKAAWPSKEIPDETIELWIDLAHDIDFDDAKAAALDIVKTDDWFPTIARFRQQAGVHANRRNNHAAAERGLPQGGFEQPPAALIAATRQLVEERTQSQESHWHGGPGQCPICGGTRQPRPSDGLKPERKYRRPPTYSGGPQIGAPVPAKAADYDQVYRPQEQT